MYLLKSTNGLYFSRVCTPKPLLKQGYPFDIKVSLMTKDRHVAIQRNFDIAACIKQAFFACQTLHPIPYKDFKSALNQRIQAIREQSFYIIPSSPPRPIQKPAVAEPTVFDTDVDFEDEFGSDLPEGSTSEDVHNPFPYRGYLKLFIDSKKALRVNHLTCHQLEQRINHFIQYAEKHYIAEATSADIMRYLDVLNSEKRAPKTNKDYFASTKQFLKWLNIMGYASPNPAESITGKFKAIKHASEERDRWTQEELQFLFDHPEYLRKNDDFKWVTLLQLYHGLRPNEACQLHTNDIKHQGGIYYLSITDSASKQHLKNEHAVRPIPLHSEILANGFIEFVEQRTKRRNRAIFNFVPFGRDDDWSKHYRSVFGKMQTKIGMKPGKRPTPYGLRHTFIDELKIARILEHEVAEIVGHVNANMTFGRYGKKLELTKLQAIVNKFKVNLDKGN
ncbi:conserved hypothetical protein [Vibrio coralliirubri]|nr:conserved hypothetical protein [Vibrio coralliirubri]